MKTWGSNKSLIGTDLEEAGNWLLRGEESIKNQASRFAEIFGEQSRQEAHASIELGCSA